MKAYKIKIFIIICLLVFVIIGCTGRKEETNLSMSATNNKILSEQIPVYTKATKKLNKSDFTFIKKGQSIKYILTKIGEPYEDIGFGCYIIVYNIVGGEKMTLFFDTNNLLERWEIMQIDRGQFYIKMTGDGRFYILVKT